MTGAGASGGGPAPPPERGGDWEARLAFAERLADLARPLVMERFRTPLRVDYKADESPVTAADRTAEARMRAAIEDRFPDEGIIGEEQPPRAPGASRVWVLDPIDGTRSFVTGRPLFGTLVALVEEGRPRLGVIDMPALGERWRAAPGLPSCWNGRPVSVSGRRALAEATLSATTIDMFRGEERERFDALGARTRFRIFGSDCYAYGLLASGFLDLVVEAGLGVYDWSALVPVVEGAGGIMTDWEGRPLGLGSPGRVVAAASAPLHEAALRILGG